MDAIFLDEHSVLNGLGFAEGESDGRRSTVPSGIPLFADGALHQFVVPTNSNAPVSLIARDNLVYELFFQLTRDEQPLTGVYNHFVYTTAEQEQNASTSESATAQCRVEQSNTLYLPVVRESFRRFLAAQRANGVEQLPAFDESGAVHCLRINAPPSCAALGDPQAVKAAFDLLNIARVEPAAADAHSDAEQEARLEVTFRVGELGTAQRDKPLEVGYTVYVFDDDAVGGSEPSVPLAYTRHTVVCSGGGTQQMDALLAQPDSSESDAQPSADAIRRHIETLFRRVGVADDESLVTAFECPACRVQLVSLTDYVRHALVSHDERRCPLCDTSFATFDEPETHLPRCAARAHAATAERLDALGALGKRTHTDAALKLEYEACALVEAHLATFLGASPPPTFPNQSVSKSGPDDATRGSGNGEVVSVGDAEPDATEPEQDAQDKQPELIAVQRGRGPIQIYGDFSCKFCGRLCKTYIGLKSHVTQGHREFYNKLLLHTLEKVKEMQLERVHADSAEAERLRMLDFDAAWNGDGELTQSFAAAAAAAAAGPHAQAVPAGVNANALRWASASYAFFHELTAEMLQLAFERVLRELENGVGVLNDEVRLEQIRSRIGTSHASHVHAASAAAAVAAGSVIEWRSSVNGEIKRIDERNKRSDAFFAYRKRIQQTNELIKMMERASQGDSNKRGLWNVLDVERLFQFVSGEQVQAASRLPSRYVRGKRPRGRPPKPETLGLPPNATAEQIQQAQLALQTERLRSTKQMRIIADPLEFEPPLLDAAETRSRSNSLSVTRSASASCTSAKNDDSLSDVNASECSTAARADSLGDPVEIGGDETHDAVSNELPSPTNEPNESNDAFLARCRLINGRFECADCATLLPHRDALLKHRRFTHTNRSPKFACDSDPCSKRCSSSLQMTEQRNSHTTAMPYACAVCAAQFATRATFYRHVQLTRHENAEFAERRMYTCALCSLSFRNEIFLRVHHNQVHKDLPCPSDCNSSDAHVDADANETSNTGPAAPATEHDKTTNSADGDTHGRTVDTGSKPPVPANATQFRSGPRKTAQPIRVIRAQQTATAPSTSGAPALVQTQRGASVNINVAQKRVNPPRLTTITGNSPRPNADPAGPTPIATQIMSAVRKSTDTAPGGNPEVVYRCGLCESLFPSLADVITHQQEFQLAQVRESRLKELDELRKREHELLATGLIEQPAIVGELTATRAQMSALEEELGGAQAVQYFCRMCHALFTSECLAQQHAREVHATGNQPSTAFADDSPHEMTVTAGDAPTPPDFAATFSGALPGDAGLAQIAD